jgi:hypothetical protein
MSEFPTDLERAIFYALKKRKELGGDGLRARELEALEDVDRARRESKLDRPMDAALSRLKTRKLIRFSGGRVGWEIFPGAELPVRRDLL